MITVLVAHEKTHVVAFNTKFIYPGLVPLESDTKIDYNQVVLVPDKGLVPPAAGRNHVEAQAGHPQVIAVLFKIIVTYCQVPLLYAGSCSEAIFRG